MACPPRRRSPRWPPACTSWWTSSTGASWRRSSLSSPPKGSSCSGPRRRARSSSASSRTTSAACSSPSSPRSPSIRPVAPSILPHSTLSVIHIPSQVLPRFIPLPDSPGKHSFMLLEDVIRLHLPTIYNGYEIVSSHAIRVTRDAYLQPRGGREDLLVSIEESLRERRLGTAVRLQHDGDLPPDILATLLDELELSPEDLFEGEGFAAFSDLFQLYTAVDVPRLKDRPLPPHPVPAFEAAADMWSAIRARDVLVHHPYHTFDAVRSEEHTS